MKLKPSQSVAANARELLPKMVKKYFEAGREVMKAKTPPDELHSFRLKTKRFRYTLELFRPVYGPQLDDYLDSLRALQSAFGKVSDHQAIHRIVGDDEVLDDQIRTDLKQKVKDLRKEWKAFDSGGALKRWRSYLGSGRSQPRRPKTAPPRKGPQSAGKMAVRKQA